MNISTKSERLVDLGDVADVVAGASADSLAGARRNAPACPPAPARRRTTSLETPTSRATGAPAQHAGKGATAAGLDIELDPGGPQPLD
jgi:hypothetical protein